ncbi:MAG: hypothetical protein AB7K09_11070 [Planctomycetota bacterium]
MRSVPVIVACGLATLLCFPAGVPAQDLELPGSGNAQREARREPTEDGSWFPPPDPESRTKAVTLRVGGEVLQLQADPFVALPIRRWFEYHADLRFDPTASHVLRWNSKEAGSYSATHIASLAQVPNLVELHIPWWRLEPGAVDELVKIRTLRRLSLGPLSADQLAALRALPELDYLAVEKGVPAEPEVDAGDAYAQLTNLRELRLHVTGRLASVARMPSLRRLCLIQPTEAQLLDIAASSSIEALEVRFPDSLSKAVTNALKAMPALRELDLIGLRSPGSWPSGIETLPLRRLDVDVPRDKAAASQMLAPVALCRTIRSLTLRGATDASLQLLLPLADSLTGLTLGLSHGDLPTLARFGNLRTLSLNRLASGADDRPGDATLAAIGRLELLESLDLRGINLRPDSLRHLQGLTHLRDLALADATGIDAGTIQLLTGLPLERLALARCEWLDDRVCEPVSKIATLHELDLSLAPTFENFRPGEYVPQSVLPEMPQWLGPSKGITRAGLEQILTLPKLSRLGLVWHKQIDDTCCELLKDHPQWQRLDLCDCGLSARAVRDLRLAFPRAQILW